MTQDQTLLSNAEAAALLGVTPDTLKFWRHKGRGPAFVKFGDTPRLGVGYDPEDVAAWIAGRKFASTSAYSPAARANAKPTVRRSAAASA